MDSYILGENITVACVTAAGFPEGIEEAHRIIHQKFAPAEGRRYFGLSWPDKSGRTIYKAAAEILDGERTHDLDIFTIKRGAYMSFFIKDYREHTDAIKRSFGLLTNQAEADPNGYCLEWYIGEHDVKCMVLSGPENYPENPEQH